MRGREKGREGGRERGKKEERKRERKWEKRVKVGNRNGRGGERRGERRMSKLSSDHTGGSMPAQSINRYLPPFTYTSATTSPVVIRLVLISWNLYFCEGYCSEGRNEGC